MPPKEITTQSIQTAVHPDNFLFSWESRIQESETNRLNIEQEKSIWGEGGEDSTELGDWFYPDNGIKI